MTRTAWLLFASISAAVIGWRFEPVVDLAWFLPAPTSASEKILLEQLGQGPGSRLLFISLEAEPDSNLALVSQAVASQLRTAGQFREVISAPVQFDVESIPPVVWRNRYLLADLQLNSEALRQMLMERRADLALVGEPWLVELIAADLPLSALDILKRTSPADSMDVQWIDEGAHRALLLAETRAPAFDMAGQKTAVDLIRQLTTDGLVDIDVLGMGVYGVDLQETISSEASARSIVATLIVATLLILVYRRPSRVFAAMLTLLLGALAAVAMIALLFSKVHGITLAFGFTLLGVAVDYPLHYLSNTRSPCAPQELETIWPTMFIGMLTTVLAFLAIAAGGSLGLAQIGVFAATGVAIVFAATRSLLPILCPPDYSDGAVPSKPAVTQVTHLFWCAAFVFAVVLLTTISKPRWTDDLSVVSPISETQMLQDRDLRAKFGAPDIRTLIAVRDPDLQSVLETTESVSAELRNAQQAGLLSDFRSVSNLVPSEQMQAQRIAVAASVPDLDQQLSTVARNLGFRSDAFAPFVKAVHETAQRKPVIKPADFADSPLSSLVEGMLYRSNDEWVSLTTLFGINDMHSLSMLIEPTGAQMVDIKLASVSLMRHYRERMLWILGVAAGLIALYLWLSLRSIELVRWVLGTLAASQALTLLISELLLPQLSIFNLIALVLVAGLGIDYTLFYARSEPTRRSARNTRHALAISALSTGGAFSILAFSAIPILQSMGVTVAAGVICTYLLARLGRLNH